MSGSTRNTALDQRVLPISEGGAGWLHVAVGVVRNARHQVLIARRQPGTHLAGCWEFPGGKLEHGESTPDALRRELREELGIEATVASPLITVRHRYPERRVLLDVWQVTSFSGDPSGLQGQVLRWVDPEDLPYIAFPAANRPIATAARLPDRYAILDADSDDPEELFGLLMRLAAQGLRMIQLRAKRLAAAGHYRVFAARALAYCRVRDILLLLNADPAVAHELDADGVQLNASRLMQLRERPLSGARWVAASCHDLAELQQAERLGLDFAVLSPVARTLTHPDRNPLGWPAFAAWVAQVNIPVFALGGLSVDDLPQARACGAQGIAGIRGFL